MLIEKAFERNDVITVKIVGGDEIIGRIQDPDCTVNIELLKPMVVMMAQQGFGMMPFILTAGPDTTVKIKSAHVLAAVRTLPQVAKEYMKQTTGLEI